MPVDRKDITKILEEISILLELKGENPFKVRAYENAVRALATVDGDIEDLIRSGKLGDVKGFGKALMEKLSEFVETGKIDYLERLRAEFPKTLLDLLSLNGVGPKKAKLFYSELNVTTIDELEKACIDGRAASLPGMGVKSVEKILDAIRRYREVESLYLFADARAAADVIMTALRDMNEVVRVELAGSLRRFKEITKDIDIIASTANESAVMDRFVALPQISEVLSKGQTKTSVILESGIQADLRLVPDNIYPFALHHFTGSKDHNVEIRSRAIRMGMKVSEWGLFKTGDEQESLIPCANETDFFKHLKLHFIPPELREGLGEIEFAEQHDTPKLVTLAQYRGVLHCHSTASDGVNSIEELVAHAIDLGHEYLGVTDHSKSSFQANGLSEERLIGQVERIRSLKSRYAPDFTLYSGVECDIGIDGSLDYDDEILEKLDLVIVSVHSGFSRTKAEMTNRVIRAMEHPAAKILAHPTGRLLLKRDAYDIDMEKIIDAAVANSVAIELNCNPMRMDMDWRLWKKARDKGVMCSLNPDSHSLSHFDFVRDGIGFCRKGWLTVDDIINCWPATKLNEFFGI